MNRFALGFGFSLAAPFAGWMLYLTSKGPPSPDPVGQAVALAAAAAVILGCGWFAVRQLLLLDPRRDIRAEFRAADPRGWRAPAAGFLSGVAGIAAAIGAFRAIAPSGNERDPTTIIAGALVWLLIGTAPVVGALLFLWVFHPCSTPLPPGGPCP